MKKQILILAMLSLALPTTTASARAGDLDWTFGDYSMARTDFGGQDIPVAVTVAPDSKIVSAGYTFRSNIDYAVSRLTASGRPDRTFNRTGKAVVGFGGEDLLSGVAVQRDGKVVLAGTRLVPPQTSSESWRLQFALARLRKDGKLDSTFGAGGKVLTDFFAGGYPAFLTAIVLQRDGKIVVGGATSVRAPIVSPPYPLGRDSGYFLLARYNTNGTLDPTFGAGGRLVFSPTGGLDTLYSLAVDKSGAIIAAGSSKRSYDAEDFVVVRMLATGALDPTFGVGGVVSAKITSQRDVATVVRALPSGKIVVGGTAIGTNTDFAVARFNGDGTPDKSFSRDGKVRFPVGSGNDFLSGLAVQSDGKIIASGGRALQCFRYQNYEFCLSSAAVVRLTGTGGLDRSFGSGGKVYPDLLFGNAVVALQGSKPVLAGWTIGSRTADFGVIRLMR